jgi:catechol 2,3-dioxygenase-like lactoylglutathione lyase family enzyme
MIKALRTVIYPVSDVAKAKEFYTALTGAEPYYDQPYYIGYNVGGFELGLDPNRVVSHAEGGQLGYWYVENIEKAYEHALSIGAKKRGDIQEVGEGIKVVAVEDPFGNPIGLMEDPSFKSPK